MTLKWGGRAAPGVYRTVKLNISLGSTLTGKVAGSNWKKLVEEPAIIGSRRLIWVILRAVSPSFFKDKIWTFESELNFNGGNGLKQIIAIRTKIRLEKGGNSVERAPNAEVSAHIRKTNSNDTKDGRASVRSATANWKKMHMHINEARKEQ